MKDYWREACLVIVCGLLLAVTLACGTLPPISTPLPRPTSTWSAPPTFTPAPTRTPLPPDTGWQPVRPGVEIRSIDIAVAPSTERVTVARLDPSQVTFRVVYTPGIAYPISAWAQQQGALLVVNGGYFTSEEVVTGLTISGGVSYGAGYGDYAGMFAVTSADAVSVRRLRAWPYDPAEGLRDAIQSFPVLVRPGGEVGFPPDADDGAPSRRTVVAQDRSGRILLLIAPRGYLSLHEMAVWLAGSDLDVDTALNLDGGTSSGFWMVDGPQIESMVSVPVVIGVFAK